MLGEADSLYEIVVGIFGVVLFTLLVMALRRNFRR